MPNLVISDFYLNRLVDAAQVEAARLRVKARSCYDKDDKRGGSRLDNEADLIESAIGVAKNAPNAKTVLNVA